ncbi:Spy/CpxP family protein refolding chaperone [Fundidesulfovibrio terrae]|uniref:Spy/CpxP family protein refolding chaperone n=1 Tax=Fundidesulfovibrio terrae TaxID=2922866 RepID=UPI001FAE8092|nr:Spy/CpxP family protein refolding chaperone [Fundidesulfovibrio terrae]
MIPRSIIRAARASAAVALLAVLAVVTSVPPAQAQQPQAKAKMEKASPADASKPEQVEKRIADLREQLRITPAQEPAWNDLAKVMRDNASRMKTLLDKWSTQKDAMTAVENLKIHLEMADEHAQALRQLIPAFEKLYASMTDDQKKTADDVFANRMNRGKKKAR